MLQNDKLVAFSLFTLELKARKAKKNFFNFATNNKSCLFVTRKSTLDVDFLVQFPKIKFFKAYLELGYQL